MTITNNTNATDFGIKAAAAWDRSASNGDAGDALAICAMYLAARTMTFSASVSRKGSDIEETIDFDFDTWERPVYNADGSKDTKAMAARTLAVANKLFGLSELSNAHKQRIERAKRAALYLYQRNIAMDDDAYANNVTMRGNKLVVPHSAVHAEPPVDADDNERTLYEAMKDKLVTLDGKNGNSLAELGKRARPVSTKAATGVRDKGASLMDSLNFVQAVMTQATDEDAKECDVALSIEMRRKLYEVMTVITTYFDADPIEVEEQNKKAA